MTVPAALKASMRFWRNTSDRHRLQPGSRRRPAGRDARLRVGRGRRQRLPARRPDAAVVDDRRPSRRMYLAGLRLDLRRRHRHAQRHAVPPQQRRARVRRRHGPVAVGPRRQRTIAPGPPADVRMQQATVNLFADMGVQPGSLRAGLSPPSASTDTLRRPPRITSPAAGATVQSGTPVTITGTASDTGGGVVAGVEVSVDGGATWRTATGQDAAGATCGRPRPSARDTARRRCGAARWTTAATSRRRAAGRTVTVAPARRAGGGIRLQRRQRARRSPISPATATPARFQAPRGRRGSFGSALSFDGVNDLGHGQRRQLARSHHWNDARGVDQPDHAQRLAERDPQADDDDGLLRVLRKREPSRVLR